MARASLSSGESAEVATLTGRWMRLSDSSYHESSGTIHTPAVRWLGDGSAAAASGCAASSLSGGMEGGEAGRCCWVESAERKSGWVWTPSESQSSSTASSFVSDVDLEPSLAVGPSEVTTPEAQARDERIQSSAWGRCRPRRGKGAIFFVPQRTEVVVSRREEDVLEFLQAYPEGHLEVL